MRYANNLYNKKEEHDKSECLDFIPRQDINIYVNKHYFGILYSFRKLINIQTVFHF